MPDDPPATNLTTRASVKAFAEIDETRTEQDEAIDLLIPAASSAITAYTQREFTPTAAATRRFVDDGSGFVGISGLAELTSIDDVTCDDPVAVTDYKLRPISGPPYTWLEVPIRTTERELEIVGDWGFAAIPDDVKHWCNVTVTTWLRRDISAFETTFSIDMQRLERPEALPSAVRAGLRPYVIRSVG